MKFKLRCPGRERTSDHFTFSPSIRFGWIGVLFVLAFTSCNRAQDSEPLRLSPPLPSVQSNQLRAVADFAVFPDQKERSRALFLEASRVLLHPRCANCHPDGDVPAQGMEMSPHQPPVTRGPDSHGVVGMECTGCHQDHNLALARVPGAPKWHLAPREMAWVGKTPSYVCEQMKDPKRNGGKSLTDIVEHNAHDKLVGWGWFPGADREPAPGTQEQFGAIIAAWVQTGAECPTKEARP
jgi:hypothetical protein